MKQFGRLLALYLFLVTNTILSAQDQITRFDHITTREGLPHNTVSFIHQDRTGFLWFGTQGGLGRYDGYNFISYMNEPGNPNSLAFNDSRTILEDEDGIFWIGTTGGGLHRFDPSKQTFTHYRNSAEDPSSIGHDQILSLCRDHQGNLWIGTLGGGLDRTKPGDIQFVHYRHDAGNPGSITNNSVRSLLCDSRHNLWIGTENGVNLYNPESDDFTHFDRINQKTNNLYVEVIFEDAQGILWFGTSIGLFRFNRETEELLHYRHEPGNANSLSSSRIITIYEDNQGILWIGTYGGGLNRLEPKTGQIKHYLNDPNNPFSLKANNVWSILQDRSGILWVGTEGGGINRLNLSSKPFVHFGHNPNNLNSLSQNGAWAIIEDHKQNIWFGTNRGLNQYDPVTRQFTHFFPDSSSTHSINHDVILSLLEDRSGNLWIGTYGGGLDVMDADRKKFRHYVHDPENPASISHNAVLSLLEDRTGKIWVGTFNGGLNFWDPESGRFTRFIVDPKNPNGLNDDIIWSLHEDTQGLLWIGTSTGGLNCYDPETGQFTHYTYDQTDPDSISHNTIMSIYEDYSGNLWMGTSGGGLNYFDRQAGKFQHYTIKDGLPDDTIFGILKDKAGYLWLSTNKGVSKFNPQNRTFQNYDYSNGLVFDDFSFGAYCQSHNGRLFFGTNNDGIISFTPENISDDQYIPPVVITDFKISNRMVPIGENREGRVILSESITNTQAISLNHSENTLSFEFAALHYASPEKNQYAYRLEGWEKEWNYVGNRRFVTYTNLPPNHYIFRVKAANNDGIWNQEGRAIRISISPPFWITWWFRGLIILSSLLILVAIIRTITSSATERARKLEEKVEERTYDLQQEITRRKQHQQAAQRRAAQSALIYDIGQQVSSQLKLEVLLPAIVLAIRDVFDYYGVMLLLPDKNNQTLVLKAIAGNLTGIVPGDLKITIDEGMIGKAASSGKTQFSGDVDNHPHYRRGLEEETQSELTIPIKKEDRVIGVLDIQSNKKNTFDQSDIEAMETLSTQIANAIENAELYKRAQIEIQERKRTEKELREHELKIKSSLKEKEVLLKEIHHRVKNNMQIVSSLLNLQSRQIRDDFDKAIFQESKDRIRAMALIHEKLYQAADLSNIQYSDYVHNLADNLLQSYRISDKQIKIHIKTDNIALDINRAIPCSLIINELISNSLKYAFPTGKSGKIWLHMHENHNHEITLSAGDNGIGFPENMDFTNSPTLGLQLVVSLVNQLDGKIELKREKGTEFVIRFK